MASLKERVERLESQLSKLQTSMQRERGKDWRRAVEKYAGDDDLLAVFSEAMKLREADRRRARAKQGRSGGKRG
jgi:hypothetical protein